MGQEVALDALQLIGGTPALDGASILVVEDDPTLLAAVARLLCAAGAEVHSVPSGDWAIALAITEHLDLLLTDMDLPGRDGAAVAAAVVAIQPAVVVVFMSGRTLSSHVARGRLARDAAFIEKPFDARDLLDRVAGALAKRPGGGRAPVTA